MRSMVLKKLNDRTCLHTQVMNVGSVPTSQDLQLANFGSLNAAVGRAIPHNCSNPARFARTCKSRQLCFGFTLFSSSK